MTKPMARDPIYRKRAFDAEIIELCVRWYITYRLSYRYLVEMMAERGGVVAHSTILRWVTRFVPEYEKRWNRFSRPVGTSWRTDETYISIRGKWHYLYRAVDKQGKTVDFLLRRDRVIAADVSVPSSFIKLVQHRHSFRCGLIWSKVSISQGRDGRCVTKKILNFHQAQSRLHHAAGEGMTNAT